MKVCSTCKEEKSLDNFYNRKLSEDGKGYRCKDCDNLAREAYRAKHRERHLKAQRERNWKHKYGISRDFFENMCTEQLGKCKICAVNLTNVEIDNVSKSQYNTAHVDHCHITGKVRGLLCARCNKGLGMFDDESEKLFQAYQYLLSHEIH